MLDRESTFRDPEIVSLLKSRFIPVAIDQTYSGDYVVCLDPLDGSSNIDAGISVGSIFGIFAPAAVASRRAAEAALRRVAYRPFPGQRAVQYPRHRIIVNKSS